MLSFRREGIYCEAGGFYVDPWLPVKYAVITHAHADHARSGMEKYLCHKDTLPILKLRLGEHIQVDGLPYNRSITLNGVKISLHPAGHTIGSAQVRMEYKGQVSVVSGDYKLQIDGLSAPFEPVKCHTFVTESTFGLPIYHWESVEHQNSAIQKWANTNREQGKTSIFVAYSLGKAQRVMKALNNTIPIKVHFSIGRINSAMEEAGIILPDYEVADLREHPKLVESQALIVPPALLESNMLKKISKSSLAICSGWMQVRGARRWRNADMGFAISDHADWDGLCQAVEATGAEKIYVTHGFTSAFSRYLRERGFDAEEIKTEFGDEEDPLVNDGGK